MDSSSQPAINERDSVIGPSVVIRGDVVSRESTLTVMGTVEGVIDHDQFLRVNQGANIDADVRAREMDISGVVKGDIYGTNNVRILRGGRVEGNIYAKLFSVEEGASLKGGIIMDATGNFVNEQYCARHPADSSKPPVSHQAIGSDHVDRLNEADGD